MRIDVSSYHNSPIRALPSEIVLAVFICIFDHLVITNRTPAYVARSLASSSLVSRRWRDFIRGIPELWTFISTKWPTSQLDVWTQRAGNLSLRISVDGLPKEPVVAEMDHAAQLRSILRRAGGITVRNCGINQWTLFETLMGRGGADLGLLELIAINNPFGNMWVDYRIADDLHNRAPRLRRFTARSAHPRNVSSITHQLEHLELSQIILSRETLLGILEPCLRLQTLIIKRLILQTVSSSLRPHLPQLSILSFGSHNNASTLNCFLGNDRLISYPNLRCLDVRAISSSFPLEETFVNLVRVTQIIRSVQTSNHYPLT